MEFEGIGTVYQQIYHGWDLGEPGMSHPVLQFDADCILGLSTASPGVDRGLLFEKGYGNPAISHTECLMNHVVGHVHPAIACGPFLSDRLCTVAFSPMFTRCFVVTSFESRRQHSAANLSII